jgi:hypothetical protein
MAGLHGNQTVSVIAPGGQVAQPNLLPVICLVAAIREPHAGSSSDISNHSGRLCEEALL